MTRECRKCGGTRITGPSYDSEKDRLKFICNGCGYFWTTPTEEQKRKDFEESRRHRGEIE